MFVPSKPFFLQLSRDDRFWWSSYWHVPTHRQNFTRTGQWNCPPPISSFREELVEMAYEYDVYHAEALTFFNSWEDLIDQLKSLDVTASRRRAVSFARRHQAATLDRWYHLLRNVTG